MKAQEQRHGASWIPGPIVEALLKGERAVEDKPLVVLGGNGNWPSGAVEALLRGRGYKLRSMVELAEMVRVIHKEEPDLIILARGMRGGDPLGLCRNLRGRRWLATTPIFYLCSEGRAEEASALEAGAWDAVKCPPDPELFLARVENAVQMKRKADEALRLGLIDQMTGCYNRAGLMARLEEEILHARRHKEPLACLVVALEPFPRVIEAVGDPEAGEAAFLAAARILRQGSRRTDILARHEEYEFAIVAPATGRAGVRKLVNRINDAFANSPVRVRAKGQASPFRPIIGITVRASWPGEEETPETLIDEASEALALARQWGSGHRIYSQVNGANGS